MILTVVVTNLTSARGRSEARISKNSLPADSSNSQEKKKRRGAEVGRSIVETEFATKPQRHKES